MELLVLPLLKGDSRKAFLSFRKQWGWPKRYNPRYAMLLRLQEELNMSESEVRKQIVAERLWIAEHWRYFKNQ